MSSPQSRVPTRLLSFDTKNFRIITEAFASGSGSLVACTLRGKPIPVICVLCNADTPGRTPSYVPFALLVNEFNTDLLNELVPPPSLHGDWCWIHVPQKDPPPPLVPPEGDANEAGESA